MPSSAPAAPPAAHPAPSPAASIAGRGRRRRWACRRWRFCRRGGRRWEPAGPDAVSATTCCTAPGSDSLNMRAAASFGARLISVGGLRSPPPAAGRAGRRSRRAGRSGRACSCPGRRRRPAGWLRRARDRPACRSAGRSATRLEIMMALALGVASSWAPRMRTITSGASSAVKA